MITHYYNTYMRLTMITEINLTLNIVFLMYVAIWTKNEYKYFNKHHC